MTNKRQSVKNKHGKLTPLVEYQGRYYLEMKVERVVAVEYRRRDGSAVPEEHILPWLRKRSRTESSRQGVSKQIVLRDFAIDNIVKIRIAGQTYVVKDK